MKINRIVSSVALTLTLAATAAHAAKIKDTTYTGAVTQSTSAGFTVLSKKTAQTINVTVTPATRYVLLSPTTIAALAVGQTVTVEGVPDTAGTTVAATHITVLDANLPAKGAKKHAGAGKNDRYTGTITASTPSLVISTMSGDTVTVNTAAVKRVDVQTPGTASELQVGESVRVRGQLANSATTAAATTSGPTEVAADQVTIVKRGRMAHMRKGKKALLGQ